MASTDYSFADLQARILAAVRDLDSGLFPGETEGLTLLDGFITHTLQSDIKRISLGGKVLPSVAIIGNSTGKIYYFALKKLLPDLDFGD